MINIGCPKASFGTIIGIRGENAGTISPDLIDVLDDDKGLRYRFIIVDENRDFLVYRVGFKEEQAFGTAILLEVLIVDGFHVEGDLNSINVWTCTSTKKLHITCCHD